MDETRVVSELGRQWLLQLADWFEATAGQETRTSIEDSITVAQGLREIAGQLEPAVPENLGEELEAWYARPEAERND